MLVKVATVKLAVNEPQISNMSRLTDSTSSLDTIVNDEILLIVWQWRHK